ncbi:patatin-like phospholipase family protein [Pollutimonas harenae]|uniref:Patatin-like phospholipase family protein n=1 Tax=Pollutimonas harenae TaxID=657015 RepID=A0A853H227_9BURK|nr:patatin-like phospholipase family protein [Pollutimonas harenae]NYT85295.1 patatin-like phospholipase family protein [Pollutimonas harenae]TEA70402.1 patatin-like phospholipase family protein [Pollutimonas harenae]
MPEAAKREPVGLVLTGGGARAAYQVGVLAGILEILDPDRSPGFVNPFDIICGSSAGAINAAAMACRANDPHLAADRLQKLWSNLHTGDVYHADAAGLLRTGLRWFAMLGLGWLLPHLRDRQPRSLLDNTPLGKLLSNTLDFDHLQANLGSGVLSALAITATAYTTGEHLTFYQSHGVIKPWQRSLRQAVPCKIGIDHLLASSAIPFIFPAQAMLIRGQTQWCGDGSMRQLAPMSPAIHLGAEKIVVIGTGYKDDTHPEERDLKPKYPTLAQIGGHALSNIFLDSLSMDVERTQRLNELLALVPEEAANSLALRPIRTFVVTPSSSLDDLAMAHLEQLPRAARTLFRVLGVSSASRARTGGALISYLLFEASYTQELIRLGRADSLSRVDEVKAFFKETPV